MYLVRSIISMCFTLFIALAATLFAGNSHASTLQAGPDNYRLMLKGLGPGDTLELAPGEYREGLPVHHLNGRLDAPIVIKGAESEKKSVFLARVGANTVSLVNASHITIRNLVLEGQGLMVDAVKAEGHASFAHHITLENLTIRGYGGHQQIVGISSKCPAWNWIVRNNVIIGAGTGMYFGDSRGSAPFIAGLIEHNLIVDTLGYNLQIKHQRDRPALPGMPTGNNVTIIRHNAFSKEKNGATGNLARPNVLIGHWPLRGNGNEDKYLIYSNLFYQNPTEALFQGEGNLALYNNLFVNHFGGAIHIQPHNDIPKHIRVLFNTIVARGEGIRILPVTPETHYSRHVAGNLIFTGVPFSGARDDGNFTQAYAHATRWLINPLGNLDALDLRIKSGAIIPPAKPPRKAMPIDVDTDFSGRLRATWAPGAFDLDAQPLSLSDMPHLPQ